MNKIDLYMPQDIIFASMKKEIPFDIVIFATIVYVMNFDINFIVCLFLGYLFMTWLRIQISSKYVYLSIDKNGFYYKNWRGQDVQVLWNENVLIKDSKKNGQGGYELFHQEKRILFLPMPIILSKNYRKAINLYAPNSSPLRDLASQDMST